MGRLTLSLFLAICCIGATHGTDCSYGSATNLLHKIAKTCPIPLVHASDEYYCCEAGCCNLVGYMFSGYRIIIIIIITVILVAIAALTRCCTTKPGFFQTVQKPTSYRGGPVYPGVPH